jgi:hypothetical protein
MDVNVDSRAAKFARAQESLAELWVTWTLARLRLNFVVFIAWHRRAAPIELARWSLAFYIRLVSISGLALYIKGGQLPLVSNVDQAQHVYEIIWSVKGLLIPRGLISRGRIYT